MAIVLATHPLPSLLMIKRAERPGDPWSGDMAFPGGRREPGDPHHVDTALRELHEEVGVHLNQRPIAALSTVWTKSHNSLRPMVIHPYVFQCRHQPCFHLSSEVSAAIWIPLEILTEQQHQHFYWEMSYLRIKMPCIYYKKHRIWGLSLKMIGHFLASDYFATLQWK